MRLAELGRVPCHVRESIHNGLIRICARFKRFRIRSSSIVGTSFFIKPVSFAWNMGKKSKE
jgi:hypothetical protein